MSRALGLALLMAWGPEATAALLDDADYDKLYDRGGPWDVAAWKVAGYAKDGDHFHAANSSAWTYGLSSSDADLVWSTLARIARAGDASGSSPPRLESAPEYESTGGRIRLAVVLHRLWEDLKEWRRVRTAQATTPRASSSSSGSVWLLLLGLFAASRRSTSRRRR